MKSYYLQCLKNLLIFSAILGIIIWGLSGLIPNKVLSPALPYQFFFFVAFTIIVCFTLIKASRERFNKFLNTYLLITTVKLLFFLVVILVYIFRNRSDAAPFAISFFILYLCFSIFEVVTLVTYSKKFPQSRV
jgi:hypothetical protein